MASEKNINQKKCKPIRCNSCGDEVRKRLIETENGPDVRLACRCKSFQRTQGIYVPFENDLPDDWYNENVER